MDGAVQLITVFLVFVFVLIVTWATTRWIAQQQQGQMFNKNIRVIETFKVTSNKYIQIVQTGEKYLVIAICKDTITMLTELSKDELDETVYGENNLTMKESFKELLDKAKKNVLKK